MPPARGNVRHQHNCFSKLLRHMNAERRMFVLARTLAYTITKATSGIMNEKDTTGWHFELFGTTLRSVGNYVWQGVPDRIFFYFDIGIVTEMVTFRLVSHCFGNYLIFGWLDITYMIERVLWTI